MTTATDEDRSLGRAIKAVVGAAIFVGAVLGALSGLVAAVTTDGGPAVGDRLGALWFLAAVAVPAVVVLTLRSELAGDADDEAPPVWWRLGTGFVAAGIAALAFVGMATTLVVILEGAPAREVSAAVRSAAGGGRIVVLAAIGAAAGLATALARRPAA